MTQLLDRTEISRAIEILESGGTVIFPTETVYGLGARIDDPKAIEKIFAAKGRPQDNPLIVHIGSISQVDDLAFDIPEVARKLMQAFWPGPLTLGLKKTDFVSDQVSAGLATVGIRMPSHPVAREILRSGLFIAAPSANPSGSPSPTREDHVKEMIGKVDAIVLAGECSVGLESTFLDLTSDPPRILRPGAVSYEDLLPYIPDVVIYRGTDKSASPGTRYRHYAPNTPVFLIKGRLPLFEVFMQQHPEGIFFVPDELWQDQPNQIRFLPEGSLEEASRQLYDDLRRVDGKADAIYIPVLEEIGIGRALMDRLIRAAQGNIINLEDEYENLYRK